MSTPSSRGSSRRRFVQAAAVAGAAPLSAAKTEPTLANADVYTRLGVKPLINGMGTVTVLGGSLMPLEVRRAMDDAARFFIHLPDLQRKVGARLAELAGVPAAIVTAGAASAITVATAASITRGDSKRYHALPDTTGMPNEILQQKAHRSGYEAQMTLVGAKIVWVETLEEAERAIGPRTAMMFFLNKADGDGRIARKDWIALGRKHNVPLFNDAAADVPPSSRLSEYVKEGFDLVAFSGGKGLMGPQCSGMLLGRKDLIEAATPAISPAGGIGRGMKVGKEEMIGLLAAVERFVKTDHQAEARLLDGRVAEILKVVGAVPGVKAEREVPRIANEVPHAAITWDEKERKLTTQQVMEKLRDGDPPIAVLGRGPGRLMISVWMMRGNEHRTVARRLKEILANG